MKQAFFPNWFGKKACCFIYSSVVDSSTSIAVNTMKIAIKAKTIVNIVINSYQVLNPSEPGGAF